MNKSKIAQSLARFHKIGAKLCITGFVGLLSTNSALAHDRFADVEVFASQIAETVHMLSGAGGNVGVSVGTDGVLIIDDQYGPMAPKLRDAIKKLSDSKIRYLINTHYHGDHTGGNAYFKENEDVTIFAHDNVRVRLINDEKVTPQALPMVTYEQGIKFHFNGDTVHVIHTPASHTDGDSFVHFETQNVIHTGDMLFRNWFPYIDLDGGGSVAGYRATLETLIATADHETRIIPGHGDLANKQDLENSLKMLKATAKTVKAMKDAGKTLEEALEAGIGSEWDSWSWRFITTERWITTLYNGQ